MMQLTIDITCIGLYGLMVLHKYWFICDKENDDDSVEVSKCGTNFQRTGLINPNYMEF